MMKILSVFFLALLFGQSLSTDSECVDENGNPISKSAFAKEGDCENYYECSNGVLITRQCPEGLAFDPTLNVCNFAIQVPGCEALDGVDPSLSGYCTNDDGSAINPPPPATRKPGTCDSYYFCQNGILTEQTCPSGLVFNPASEGCDWDYNSPECTPGTTLPPSTTTTSEDTTTSTKGDIVTEPPSDLPTSPSTPDTTVSTVTLTTTGGAGTPGTTTEGVVTTTVDPNSGCIDADGNPISNDPFATEGECTTYHQCSNGVLITKQCADGLVFDPSQNVCNFPIQVPGCEYVGGVDPNLSGYCVDDNYTPIDPPPPPTRKPGTCDTYYYCEDGIMGEQTCAEDLVFNPNKLECDYENDSPECTPGTTLPPSTTTTDAGGPITTTTDAGGPPTTTTESAGPPTTTTDAGGPPTTTTIGAGPPTTTTDAGGPPTTTTKGAGPSTTTADAGGPPTTTTESAGPPTTTADAGGPPTTTTDAGGPPTTTTESAGPTTTDAGGPPTTTTIGAGPPTTTTDAGGPPTTTTKGAGPSTTTADAGGPPTTTTESAGPPTTTIDTGGPITTTTNVGGPPTTTTKGAGPPTTTTKGAGPPTTTTDAGGPPTTTTKGEGPPTTTTDAGGPITTTTKGAGPSTTTTDVGGPPTTTTDAKGPTTTEGEGPPTTTTHETTTTTTTTTTVAQKLTYIGFVVDDTGSMGNEIVAVKEWITTCVKGDYEDCETPPTGGWLMTSFNDPVSENGPVIGPTTDVNVIIDAIGDLYAHGGGDCPEYAFTGLQNAITAIPDDAGACKMFFYSDATGKDFYLEPATKEMFVKKGCSFVPLLTGCCGTCADPCESTDPEYCINKVVDDTSKSSRKKRSVKADAPETFYYTLASTTGGTIFLTDKPSSPDDLLDFLEEEVTLGFCPTTMIAGPPPDGYTNAHDCNLTKSCWDGSMSKCYCMSETEPCPKDPIAPDCPVDADNLYLPDPTNCTMFYQCASGEIWRMPCAPGTVFDASNGVCNHPYATPPPCGTFVNEEKKD